MSGAGELGVLARAAELAADHVAGLGERHVGATAAAEELRRALDVPLPREQADPLAVVEELARAVQGGLVASPGPRYFGFVTGGALPAALAADWLTSAWDQNAGLYPASPAAAIAEDVCARWLLELAGLPASASVGLTSGATMANLTALAAARHARLAAAGWDVEERGLVGAPPLRLLVGEEVHVSVLSSLRMLGLGSGTVERIAVDGQGAMLADALADRLDGSLGPAIVCAQAGNVNTGAVDPLRELAEIAHEAGAWLHVDGAIGLWAAASERLRPQLDGLQLADSWTTDAHKWLNVPYDCGVAIVADAGAHRAAMGAAAGYLIAVDGERTGLEWAPEFSRRARAFPLYAALRSLGRDGLAELVDRCCEHAARFAAGLAALPTAEVLNDVRLNQVLVRFGDGDEVTRAVVEQVQRDGVCWLGGTVWRGRAAMRISVSGWRTTAADVDRSLDSIAAALAAPAG